MHAYVHQLYLQPGVAPGLVLAPHKKRARQHRKRSDMLKTFKEMQSSGYTFEVCSPPALYCIALYCTARAGEVASLQAGTLQLQAGTLHYTPARMASMPASVVGGPRSGSTVEE